MCLVPIDGAECQECRDVLHDVIALLAGYFGNGASLGLLEPRDGKLRLCCTLWYPQALSSAGGGCLALIPCRSGRRSKSRRGQIGIQSPCRQVDSLDGHRIGCNGPIPGFRGALESPRRGASDNTRRTAETPVSDSVSAVRSRA